MTVADLARSVAVHFTAKKHRLHQDTKHNNWVLTFVLPIEDLPAVVRDAPGGQRYTIVAVAVDDDETPKPLPAEDDAKFHGGRAPVAPDEHPTSEAARGSADGGSLPSETNPSRSDAPAKRRWSKMSRAQRAGMLCGEADFRRWLWAKNDLKWEDAMGDAAEAVRILCNVVSRTEFDTDAAAAARWDALETRFLQATGRMAVDR